MAQNPSFHGRTKHIDMQYNFIMKLVADGKMFFHFVGQMSKQQIYLQSLFLRLSMKFKVEIGTV